MNITKWVFLTILLGLPVAIYVFLQAFGQNQFDVPVYYSDGLTTMADGCEANDAQPYQVAQLSDWHGTVGIDESDKIVIYNLLSEPTGDLQTVLNNQQSFIARHGGDVDIMIVTLVPDSTGLNKALNAENHVILKVDQKKLLQIGKCILQVVLEDNSLPNQLVLVDRSRRIRGYYQPSKLEEIDRLNTEIGILLKYQNEK